MKLILNLKDKLFWIHNFLPKKFYKELHYTIFKENKIVSEDVSSKWEKSLLENLKPPQRLGVAETFNKQYTTLLRHQPFLNLIKSNITFVVHKMNRFSGITWHGDEGHKYAATFYINKRWNHNWGGEFMFNDEIGSGYIPIVGNSLILIKAPLIHKVNTVLSPNVPRLTIQSFIKNEKA